MKIIVLGLVALTLVLHPAPPRETRYCLQTYPVQCFKDHRSPDMKADNGYWQRRHNH